MGTRPDAWNPDQYGKFEKERSAPFFDLLSRVHPVPEGRAVDLGCGSGELTRVLHERTGARETIGIDTSDAMLAKAATHAGGGLSFRKGDLAAFREEGAFDLVFSNAALHWCGDHEGVLARLRDSLAPGGQLAIQMPANHFYPTHRVARALAEEEPFRAWLGEDRPRDHVLEEDAYTRILRELRFVSPDVYTTEYAHELPSREDAVEWVKGSLLTAYEARLGAERFARFLEEYRRRLFAELPVERPFRYPFRRIFLIARR